MARGKVPKDSTQERQQRTEYPSTDVSVEQREAEREEARRDWAKATRDAGGRGTPDSAGHSEIQSGTSSATSVGCSRSTVSSSEARRSPKETPSRSSENAARPLDSAAARPW